VGKRCQGLVQMWGTILVEGGGGCELKLDELGIIASAASGVGRLSLFVSKDDAIPTLPERANLAPGRVPMRRRSRRSIRRSMVGPLSACAKASMLIAVSAMSRCAASATVHPDIETSRAHAIISATSGARQPTSPACMRQRATGHSSREDHGRCAAWSVRGGAECRRHVERHARHVERHARHVGAPSPLDSWSGNLSKSAIDPPGAPSDSDRQPAHRLHNGSHEAAGELQADRDNRLTNDCHLRSRRWGGGAMPRSSGRRGRFMPGSGGGSELDGRARGIAGMASDVGRLSMFASRGEHSCGRCTSPEVVPALTTSSSIVGPLSGTRTGPGSVSRTPSSVGQAAPGWRARARARGPGG
jgi:hypothetical protein